MREEQFVVYRHRWQRWCEWAQQVVPRRATLAVGVRHCTHCDGVDEKYVSDSVKFRRWQGLNSQLAMAWISLFFHIALLSFYVYPSHFLYFLRKRIFQVLVWKCWTSKSNYKWKDIVLGSLRNGDFSRIKTRGLIESCFHKKWERCVGKIEENFILGVNEKQKN